MTDTRKYNYNGAIFLRIEQFQKHHEQGSPTTLSIEASDANIPPDTFPHTIGIFGLATDPPAQGHRVGTGGVFKFVRRMVQDTLVYRQEGAGGLTMLVWAD